MHLAVDPIYESFTDDQKWMNQTLDVYICPIYDFFNNAQGEVDITKHVEENIKKSLTREVLFTIGYSSNITTNVKLSNQMFLLMEIQEQVKDTKSQEIILDYINKSRDAQIITEKATFDMLANKLSGRIYYKLPDINYNEILKHIIDNLRSELYHINKQNTKRKSLNEVFSLIDVIEAKKSKRFGYRKNVELMCEKISEKLNNGSFKIRNTVLLNDMVRNIINFVNYDDFDSYLFLTKIKYLLNKNGIIYSMGEPDE